MKVFLDDCRSAPEGWILVRHAMDAIAHLRNNSVTHLSLDHDLGDDIIETGYDVILWIEEAVAMKNFIPPEITIHSSNPSAHRKMQLGINKIKQLAKKEFTI
jgi:hypothetical protein